MPVVPGRRHEHVRERLQSPRPCARNSRLGVALGEVRRDGQPERGAGVVELDRAGVRRVRRDAEPHARPRARPAMRSRISLEALARSSAVGAEDLEVDDRAQPESRAAPSPPRRVKLQSPTVVIPERRHSSAPTRAIASMSSRSIRRLALDVQRRSSGANGSPSPKPA